MRVPPKFDQTWTSDKPGMVSRRRLEQLLPHGQTEADRPRVCRSVLQHPVRKFCRLLWKKEQILSFWACAAHLCRARFRTYPGPQPKARVRRAHGRLPPNRRTEMPGCAGYFEQAPRAGLRRTEAAVVVRCNFENIRPGRGCSDRCGQAVGPQAWERFFSL